MRLVTFESLDIKPLSVTTNVVGLQTDDAGHVGKNSSAHEARVVGLQTDAVVVTETHFTSLFSLSFLWQQWLQTVNYKIKENF